MSFRDAATTANSDEGKENIIEKWLRDFRAQSAEESGIATRLMQFVAFARGAVGGREICGETGHITGAAWIVNREQSRVLLVFGAKENRWKLPGAHSETLDGADIFQIAQREAERALGNSPVETQNRAGLFALGERQIPQYWNTPAHLHFELIFGFAANESGALPRGAKWFSMEEAAHLGDENIARFSQKMKEQL